MLNILEPLFGELGARVAQFLITIAVVLVLVTVVYWLVRRFAAMRLGGIGRGRVPRLAVVDALPIDGRRRLVLVRRDNVEHLILVGGPSDVVVEPSIMRPRRRIPEPALRPQQPGAAMPPPPAAAAQARSAEAFASAPIPFPARASMNGAAAPRRADAYGATAVATAQSPPPAQAIRHARELPPLVQVDRQDMVSAAEAAEPFLPDVIYPPMAAQAEAMIGGTDVAVDASPFDSVDQPHLDLDDRPRSPFARRPDESPLEAEEDTAAKVSHLEQEMARLLDEISTKRSSS
jgi:flagellar biogenesis protein FliO